MDDIPDLSMRAHIQHAKTTGAKILLHIYNTDGEPDLDEIIDIAGGDSNFVIYSIIAHAMTLSELKADELEIPVELYLELLVDRMENGPD